MKKTNINTIRLQYIKEGFIKIDGIKRFCRIGYAKAKEIYDELVSSIILQGKKVPPQGIRVSLLLNYLGLDEETIVKYANEESKEMR